jgi:hypothetical protein
VFIFVHAHHSPLLGAVPRTTARAGLPERVLRAGQGAAHAVPDAAHVLVRRPPVAGAPLPSVRRRPVRPKAAAGAGRAAAGGVRRAVGRQRNPVGGGCERRRRPPPPGSARLQGDGLRADQGLDGAGGGRGRRGGPRRGARPPQGAHQGRRGTKAQGHRLRGPRGRRRVAAEAAGRSRLSGRAAGHRTVQLHQLGRIRRLSGVQISGQGESAHAVRVVAVQGRLSGRTLQRRHPGTCRRPPLPGCQEDEDFQQPQGGCPWHRDGSRSSSGLSK